MSKFIGKSANVDESMGSDAVAIFDPQVVLTRYTKWFAHLGDPTIAKLFRYHSELNSLSKSTSLVSSSLLKNAETLHFADSVQASILIHKALKTDHPLYDLGTGNGFPGLVFAALFPEKKVVLVDRDVTKLEFCRHISGVLKLTNVSFSKAAIEELPDRSVQYGVVRDIATLQKTLLLTRKLFGKGSKLFHMKSDGWANELGQVPSQLFSHWGPSLLGQYVLPETSMSRAVVLTDKLSD